MAIKAIKYFNTLIPNEQKNLNNNYGNLKEKIKLEFFLQNVKGIYSIRANLLDNKLNGYDSEQKKSQSNNTIAFENFFVCDYFFEREQKIKIIIYKKKLTYFVETTLGCIIGSRNSTFSKQYEGNETLVIKAEKMGRNDTCVDFKFSLKENGMNTYYFVNNKKIIYVISNKDKKLYSSESISNNGEFNNIQIPCFLLYPFYTINVYNNNKLIGSFNKSVDDIKKNPNCVQIKIPIKNNNLLFLYDNSEVKENCTFLDYIAAGVRIGLSIGIDFTGSNGHPLDEGTLHSLKGKKPSDYERAIRACGNIVAYYDYDQLFPVFGFGAIINSSPNKEASMCFNLNFEQNPDIYTIENIVKAYHDCIEKDKLTFAGPTEFAPIIKKVISIIRNQLLEYHILMILTDGVIDDLQETIDALVEGSFLPLSVIIIGIGNADFKKMEILDGDDVPLISSTGKKRMRDLVQFVPFSKFENDENKLSMEVLEEIPRQIVDYYTLNNYNPETIRQLLAQNIQNPPQNLFPPQNPNQPQNFYPNQNPNQPQNFYPPQDGNQPQNFYPPQDGNQPQNFYPNQNPNQPQNFYPNQNPNQPQNFYPNQNPNQPQNFYPNQNPNQPQNFYPPQEGNQPQNLFPPKSLNSPQNPNQPENQYPQQFDFEKANFDFIGIPTTESIIRNPENNINVPEIHVSIQKPNENNYNNQPKLDNPFYNNNYSKLQPNNNPFYNNTNNNNDKNHNNKMDNFSIFDN